MISGGPFQPQGFCDSSAECKFYFTLTIYFYLIKKKIFKFPKAGNWFLFISKHISAALRKQCDHCCVFYDSQKKKNTFVRGDDLHYTYNRTI